MYGLVPVTIVAALLGAPKYDRYPNASEVYACNFEEEVDVNFDRWPDGWTRRRGPRHPTYLKIETSHEPSAVGERCLRVNLNGGAATVYSPPIPVDLMYSYVLEGAVRTERLVHNVAYYSVIFLDENERPVSRHRSRRVTQTGDWEKLTVGPLVPDDRVRYAMIAVNVAPGAQMDIRGAAMFDDVWFARLPRITLRTNSPHNVYTQPQDIELTCEVSGIQVQNPKVTFELLDIDGRSVARDVMQLETKATKETTDHSSSTGANQDGNSADKGYVGAVTWKPNLQSYGFYEARITLKAGDQMVHRRQATVVIVGPEKQPSIGEFGWSLPDGDKQLSVDSLSRLLPLVGINWVKYPVWYGENDKGRLDRVAMFSERLSDSNIELVGVLADPPQEMLANYNTANKISAADIFTTEPESWYPYIEPVMTRLSLKVRWWQLGHDRDISFLGYPNLQETVAEVKDRMGRFGQDVRLGIGWRWFNQPLAVENRPWEFLSLSANPSLTAKELTNYLGTKPPEAAQRWVVLEPLSRERYDRNTRAADLVHRMMASKIGGAPAVFVPQPFSDTNGLMNDDATPGELLLPWRTTAIELAGTKYLGSIRLPGGSHNRIFARGEQATMVAWSDKPTTEVMYLGEDVQQIDIWGRRSTPDKQQHRQVIKLGPLPTFITGLSAPIVKWRQSVQFEREVLPSVFGTAHTNAVLVHNAFEQGAGGDIHLRTPGQWRTDPRTISTKLAANEQGRREFRVTLPFTAGSGREEIRIDFDMNVDRRYQFSVYRHMDVGLGDVVIDVTSRVDERGHLVVKQVMTNNTDKEVDFKCSLFVPGRKRLRTQVYRLGRGKDTKVYRLRDGHELVGKTLRLRADEIGGQRTLNYP
ncbi:MAG: hypothetical protein MI757_17810, partial [Pirellulales bacterium]|nr:hypothetical protein [Pirellulales bacterium]